MFTFRKLIFIIACFILGTASVYAEPEPFGIKIKETDIKSQSFILCKLYFLIPVNHA